MDVSEKAEGSTVAYDQAAPAAIHGLGQPNYKSLDEFKEQLKYCADSDLYFEICGADAALLLKLINELRERS